LPSPFLYGIVCTLAEGEKSRAGMIMLMFCSIPSAFLLFLGYYYQTQKKTIQISYEKNTSYTMDVSPKDRPYFAKATSVPLN